MALFRRRREPAGPAPDAPPPGDSPVVLRLTLRELTRFVNASAGRLPVDAVVAALRVTDAVGDVIDTSDDRPLDVHAVIAVRGILEDYLPTTLHAYLGLDPSVTDVPRPSGRTPKESLLEQIDSLWLAATDVLVATRARDADALLTQGSFLRTKFAGSDLDL
jgi:hypothetical protein